MLVAEVVHEMAMHAVVPRASPSVSSGQIRMDHLNQLFCSLRACVTLLCRRIDQMFQDVILDHFGDEPVQRPRHAVACCRRSFPPLRSGARQHRAGTDAPQSHQQLRFSLPAWYATLVLILSWRGVYPARVLAVEPVRPGTP